MATDPYRTGNRLSQLIDRALFKIASATESVIGSDRRDAKDETQQERRLETDDGSPAVPQGCACLGTGWVYVDQDTGERIVACSYKHAVDGLRVRAERRR